AALAAPTGVDLRLHHDDRAAGLVHDRGHRGVGLLDRHRGDADRHRHAVLREDLLALVLVDLHDRFATSTTSRTALALLSMSSFSCADSGSSITFSTPRAPSTTGTPRNRPP